MADITASDVTVTINTRRRVEGRNYFNVTLAFGDGALTYPAGGVPITIGKLGCPNIIESLEVYDDAISGYNWKYDKLNKKLTATNVGGHTHSLFLKNADVADGATTRVNADTGVLGANTGASITIAGSNGSTHGGILASATSQLLGQPSAFAIAAQTLKCEVIGW